MVPRRALLISLGVLAAAAASPALARSGLPQGLDKDSDGTLDLDEAEKAAGETFEKLDQNHDGTLDARELHAKLSKGEIAAADLDKDKTLTREEYLALVEARFNAADRDRDGTLNAAELHSRDGRALLKLLK